MRYPSCNPHWLNKRENFAGNKMFPARDFGTSHSAWGKRLVVQPTPNLERLKTVKTKFWTCRSVTSKWPRFTVTNMKLSQAQNSEWSMTSYEDWLLQLRMKTCYTSEHPLLQEKKEKDTSVPTYTRGGRTTGQRTGNHHLQDYRTIQDLNRH
jgi:hypothetical protein